MVKKNEQAKVHVESKHSGKAFDVCFPVYTCPPPKIQYSVSDRHGSSHDVTWPGTPSHPPNLRLFCRVTLCHLPSPAASMAYFGGPY